MNQHLDILRLLKLAREKLETNRRLDDINNLVPRPLRLHEKPIIPLLPYKLEFGLSGRIRWFDDLTEYVFCEARKNAELYCKSGVPFVMGTTYGYRDLLYKTVQETNLYVVISPQMGKQVVVFLAAMDIMSKQFPGASLNIL
nr:4-hydroxy-tetrahydrodipicolinate reductase 2, chloroplastic-like [Tanacetum cinerariifolium]